MKERRNLDAFYEEVAKMEALSLPVLLLNEDNKMSKGKSIKRVVDSEFHRTSGLSGKFRYKPFRFFY